MTAFHLLPPEERFWSRVNKGDACWEWTGYRYAGNYGGLKVNGRMTLAHRFSWTLAFGPIPEGACVLHKCDNPRCVRPEHLELGDKSKNLKDAYARGLVKPRRLRGEANGSAKLTEHQVHAIRARLDGGYDFRSLSREYGVSESAIRMIGARATWGHLE